MGIGYQKSDQRIIDYELYEVPFLGRPLRGPDPGELQPGQFISFVGAAQTFGRYAENPFPSLVGQALNAPVLNLGIAGAGPSFFLRFPGLIAKLNQSAFAVVQVMSGRSESNSAFLSQGGEMLTVRADGRKLGAAPAWAEFLTNNERSAVDALVDETRENWTTNFIQLLETITVPTILFWISEREPSCRRTYTNANQLFGKFPQLVDSTWLDRIEPHAGNLVYSVSSRGLPQPLTDRKTGEKTSVAVREDLGGGHRSVNNYYPSPEMHADAARALLPACRQLWANAMRSDK